MKKENKILLAAFLCTMLFALPLYLRIFGSMEAITLYGLKDADLWIGILFGFIGCGLMMYHNRLSKS